MCGVVLQDLALQHITNILWTYASFLHDVPDMLPAFTSQILKRLHTDQFNAQQLSNLLWSLCILQVMPRLEAWARGGGGCWAGVVFGCEGVRGPSAPIIFSLPPPNPLAPPPPLWCFLPGCLQC